MSTCSKISPQRRPGWKRTAAADSPCDALTRLRIEDVYPLRTDANRDFLARRDSGLHRRDGNCTPAVGQCHVDDLLVAHRLDDADLGADDTVTARAVVRDLQVLWPDAEDNSSVGAGLAGYANGE